MTNEQLQQILLLCLQISAAGKYHAFFDFSGHVNCLSLRITKATTDYSNDIREDWIMYDHSYCDKHQNLNKNSPEELVEALQHYLKDSSVQLQEAS